ncbi:hemin uptake protein HemP [Blastopirellula sp. JC732]|uniref:Hemin uptake protein HemP n=1 Tax=Blastopirellula sediminis TaxID=2894196 RepID=A0A9X1MPE6_9BACT|nr:hemin uptake protein HemP [Blastopirellula sediminis]MCC9607105.1 hemin uptake protein HemP [Blastopirellula sediminis]MCC9629602.1 hemin uptake protein HemP [Blastopirellula sediminis]
MDSEPSHSSDEVQNAPLSPDEALSGINAKIVDSNDLMEGSNEILISHKGAVYRLRETRSGKLILQK